MIKPFLQVDAGSVRDDLFSIRDELSFQSTVESVDEPYQVRYHKLINSYKLGISKLRNNLGSCLN